MKTVYIDHQIVVNQSGWTAIKSLSDDHKIRIAISSWTIREIAQGLREREDRMSFLESLAPFFIHDMLVLQRFEITSFLNEFLFAGGRLPFVMYTESFSDFLLMNNQRRVRSDYSLTDYIRAQGDTAGDLVEMGKAEHMIAMRTLQADPAGVARAEEQTNHAIMANLIPRRSAQGRPWDSSDIAEMLTFCHQNRSQLLKACPAIFAETALSHARLSDPRRQPRASDTADLFHSVSALAYSDIFVSDDGWAGDRVRLAKKSMSLQGVDGCLLVRSIDELQSLV